MSEQTQPVTTVDTQNNISTAAQTPVNTTIQYVEAKSSNKLLYIILGILGVLACCVVVILANLIVSRTTGKVIVNIPVLDNIFGNQASPKQAIQNVFDENNMKELAKKNSQEGMFKFDIALQNSQGSISMVGNGTSKRDQQNNLTQTNMNLTGKLNMGILNFDFGDGMDIFVIVNKDSETYVKYMLSEQLKTTLSGFGAGDLTQMLPDKYIKISTDTVMKQASSEELAKANKLGQDIQNLMKKVLADFESYSTVSSAKNGDVTVYSFKVDSMKLSNRLLQEKASILALVKDSNPTSNSAEDEKSFNEIVSFVKYLSIDKMDIGIKENYIASEDISLSLTRDGINYMKSLSTTPSNTASSFDLTGLSVNMRLNMNYSDSKVNIVIPTEYYTEDEWSNKMNQNNNINYKYDTTTTTNYSASTMQYTYDLKEGESCGTDGGTYLKMCADELSCDVGSSFVYTGVGYSGKCSSTCSGNTAQGYTRCW